MKVFATKLDESYPATLDIALLYSGNIIFKIDVVCSTYYVKRII